ncbi:transcription elongation factor [Jaminaea rosea]|uniref:Transcription elongation factor n=1 Tax=Jaminaea rosea TaxID=1569628 RepID=A0A316USH1_9BASI|nr:transcription elongation factor [Jaminaea rosea]PWN28237.1 transcription elongation factor [Jaminaea rosea]
MPGLSVQEIRGLHKDLAKAMADDAPKDIQALLSRLKEGVKPTEDLIRTTKIGQIVGKLRASPHAEIATKAKSLVQGWKAVIDKERASKGGSGGAGGGSSTAASSSNGGSKAGSVATTPKAGAAASSTPVGQSPSGSASPATPASGSATTTAASASSASKQATPAASAPPPASAPPDFTLLGEKTRNACLKLIFDALKLADVSPPIPESTIFAISLDIESSVFDKHCSGEVGGGVNQEYRNKMRSLSLNLKDKNNPSFRRRVVKGEIEGGKLVELTPAQMASEERLAENEALQQQNMLVAQSAAEQTAETDAFQCGRCKQRKCRYYQKQTRSADEPMTTFVTCTNCNNRWKFC